MADGSIALSYGTIKDAHISSSASIASEKQKHLAYRFTDFGQADNATPTTSRSSFYQAQGTGTLRAFNAGLNDTGTSTSIAFDLKKNGTTVLSSSITVTHSNADRSLNAGTLSVTSFVQGDVFTVHMTVSSSTGALGPFASAVFEENTAP